MDARTRAKFARLWNDGIALEEIAKQLRYSTSTLAKMRMQLGLRKRYGAEPEDGIPTPDVIRIRCLQQQTNWTDTDRKLRWQGPPHTAYANG